MRTIVIKVGGSLGSEARAGLAGEIAGLVRDGGRVAVVHGGGPAIAEEAARRGIVTRSENGLRATDAATLEVVREVLWERENPAWVAALREAGVPASGVDGAGVFEVATAAGGSLGFVGEVVRVDADPLEAVWSRGGVPVVAPMGTGGPSGPGQGAHGLHNVNADAAAGALAAALRADELLLLTDVPGVRPAPGAAPQAQMTADEARSWIARGTAKDGMVPKLQAALAALAGGVRTVRIGGGAGDAPGVLEALRAGETGTAVVDPFMPLFRRPLTLSHGVGSYVWDTSGHRYLDFVGGIAVLALGYGHPEVVRAVRRQAVSLLHTSNLYHTQAQDELAAWLTGHSFAARAFFCNSGTEAIEAAIKLARRHHWANGQPGRAEVIAFENGFHGRTYGSLSATGEPHLKEGFGPLPGGFRHLPYNDADAAMAAIGPDTAAVLVEPVQGEAGVVPADPAFLAALRDACDRTGALLVFDEVQTGVGRTGHLWAYETFGVTPDVMALAKALGGGLPLGAVVATELVGRSFGPGSHGSTFGGNPVACAAALATLKAVASPGFLESVVVSGDRLAAGLAGLARRRPEFVKGQRGLGLMRGLVLADGAPQASVLADACREAGLLVNPCRPDVLRLLPPLNVKPAEIDEALAILDGVLARTAPSAIQPETEVKAS